MDHDAPWRIRLALILLPPLFMPALPAPALFQGPFGILLFLASLSATLSLPLRGKSRWLRLMALPQLLYLLALLPLPMLTPQAAWLVPTAGVWFVFRGIAAALLPRWMARPTRALRFWRWLAAASAMLAAVSCLLTVLSLPTASSSLLTAAFSIGTAASPVYLVSACALMLAAARDLSRN